MISFHRFAEIAPEAWLVLLTDPDVLRHMPLGGDDWTLQSVAQWVASKDAQWAQNGYGPWALKLDGQFAGWGGFQREGDDADFALVLLPQFWGAGRQFHDAIIARGFGKLGLSSVSILLPPSRVRMKGLVRLRYQPDGEIEYNGERFLKFRLLPPA